MKRLKIALLMACSAPALHAIVTQLDVKKFENALKQWKISQSNADLNNTLGLYNALSADGGRWLPTANNIARREGVDMQELQTRAMRRAAPAAPVAPAPVAPIAPVAAAPVCPAPVAPAAPAAPEIPEAPALAPETTYVPTRPIHRPSRPSAPVAPVVPAAPEIPEAPALAPGTRYTPTRPSAPTPPVRPVVAPIEIEEEEFEIAAPAMPDVEEATAGIPSAPALTPDMRYSPESSSAIPTYVNPVLKPIGKVTSAQAQELKDELQEIKRQVTASSWTKGSELSRIKELETAIASAEEKLENSDLSSADVSAFQGHLDTLKAEFGARKMTYYLEDIQNSLSSGWFMGPNVKKAKAQLDETYKLFNDLRDSLDESKTQEFSGKLQALSTEVNLRTLINDAKTALKDANVQLALNKYERAAALFRDDRGRMLGQFGATKVKELDNDLIELQAAIEKKGGKTTEAETPAAPTPGTAQQWENVRSTLEILKKSEEENPNINQYFSALVSQLDRATDNGTLITDRSLQDLYREAKTWQKFINE